jgi:hypothetical protein
MTIHEALVAALAQLANPVKDAKADTGRFSYTYATLPAILDLVRPVLASHGLAITQDVSMIDGSLMVSTTIRHISGDTVDFGPIVGRAGGDWQALGSAITYARRYALTAALGIAADDDDDAAATKGHVTRSSAPPPEDPWTTPPVTEAAEGPGNRVQEARQRMGSYSTPSGRQHARGDGQATEAQVNALEKMVRKLQYENLAGFLEAEAQLMLGSEVTVEQLTKAQASVIFDAAKAFLEEKRA